jgi:hypothetical protein
MFRGAPPLAWLCFCVSELRGQSGRLGDGELGDLLAVVLVLIAVVIGGNTRSSSLGRFPLKEVGEVEVLCLSLVCFAVNME